MTHAAVSALLDRIDHLPTAPKVVQELLAEFARDEADTDRIARLVGSDPVLAVKLLRLANSSFYARRASVERIIDAVVLVGMDATRNLALSVGLTGSLRFPADFPQKVFWRFSLHTAVAARHTAALAHQDASMAFALGLMRAIGEPLAATQLAEQLREIDTRCAFYELVRTDSERRKFGFSYVDLTAELAERWHFPAPMVQALRKSDIADPLTVEGRVGASVSVAAWIAGEFEAQRRIGREAPEVVTDWLRVARIAYDDLRNMPPLPELAHGLEALVD